MIDQTDPFQCSTSDAPVPFSSLTPTVMQLELLAQVTPKR